MTMHFLDLRAAYLELEGEIDAAVKRIFNSGQYILGAEVEAFEEAFSAYCDAKYAIGVGNGLNALELALRAMNVGPGDEVIVPSNTYIATWLAVSQCGAVPVPVEPSESTYCIDPGLIESAITAKTKVILPVHLYGQPADLDPIIEIAHRNGLYVLEDAAQSHGALYKNKRIGGHGHAVAWSFYPGKNLGALGDAGAVTTNDLAIANRIRILRNYGSTVRYVHEVQGFNSRIDPVQAAVLNVKLKWLDDWNDRRRKIASLYSEGLINSGLIIPKSPDYAKPVWHLYVVRVNQRDRLLSLLKKEGIEALIHYPTPPFMQKAYIDYRYCADNFPIANKLSKEVLSLPIGPQQSNAVTSEIIEIISKIKNKHPDLFQA